MNDFAAMLADAAQQPAFLLVAQVMRRPLDLDRRVAPPPAPAPRPRVHAIGGELKPSYDGRKVKQHVPNPPV